MDEQNEFLQKVKAATAFWQEYRANLGGARREADKLNASDQAIAALGLYYNQVQERRFWRRYLRQFGYRVLRSGRVYTVRASRGVKLNARRICATSEGLMNLFTANAVAEATLYRGLVAGLAVLACFQHRTGVCMIAP